MFWETHHNEIDRTFPLAVIIHHWDVWTTGKQKGREMPWKSMSHPTPRSSPPSPFPPPCGPDSPPPLPCTYTSRGLYDECEMSTWCQRKCGLHVCGWVESPTDWLMHVVRVSAYWRFNGDWNRWRRSLRCICCRHKQAKWSSLNNTALACKSRAYCAWKSFVESWEMLSKDPLLASAC